MQNTMHLMDARDLSVNVNHPSLKGLISGGKPLIVATKEEVKHLLPTYEEAKKNVIRKPSFNEKRRPNEDTCLQIYWLYHYADERYSYDRLRVLFNTTGYWIQSICSDIGFYEVRLGKSLKEADRLHEKYKSKKVKRLKNENKRLTKRRNRK